MATRGGGGGEGIVHAARRNGWLESELRTQKNTKRVFPPCIVFRNHCINCRDSGAGSRNKEKSKEVGGALEGGKDGIGGKCVVSSN